MAHYRQIIVNVKIEDDTDEIVLEKMKNEISILAENTASEENIIKEVDVRIN